MNNRLKKINKENIMMGTRRSHMAMVALGDQKRRERKESTQPVTKQETKQKKTLSPQSQSAR